MVFYWALAFTSYAKVPGHLHRRMAADRFCWRYNVANMPALALVHSPGFSGVVSLNWLRGSDSNRHIRDYEARELPVTLPRGIATPILLSRLPFTGLEG